MYTSNSPGRHIRLNASRFCSGRTGVSSSRMSCLYRCVYIYIYIYIHTHTLYVYMCAYIYMYTEREGDVYIPI